MTRFRVEWTDPRGEPVRADLDAPDRDALLTALEPAQRETLRHLAPASDAPADGRGDVAWAAHMLSGLLARGVPLGPALRDLAAVAGKGSLGHELERAARATDEGKPLTDVLERGPLGPALSTPLVRGMLEAGERASRLPDLLLEAARLADRLAGTRRRVRGALLYPLLLVGGTAVAFGLMATAIGGGMAKLLESGALEVRAGRSVLMALAAAGERPDVLWTAVAAFLVLLFAAWRSSAGGLAPMRLRPVRDAAALQSLAALVAGDVSPAEAGKLLDEGATGLLPAAAARPLLDGAPLGEALERGGLVDGAERRALEAGAKAGARDLAATLRELADARLVSFEDRARALSFRLAVLLEVGVGLALLCLGLPFLGSVWR